MDLFEGKVWTLGDNLDTDVICPGRLLDAPIEEVAEHTLESIKPEFPKQVKPGDIIVAGETSDVARRGSRHPRCSRRWG